MLKFYYYYNILPLLSLAFRLLSGSIDEAPLYLNLNKVARQIKVDKERKKVVVRFLDGLQVFADIVVVAVPVSVIASGDLLFEPDLPKKYRLAAQEISKPFVCLLTVHCF